MPSNHKGLQVGDLVYYKINHKTESTVDRTRAGLIVRLGAPTASGFSFAAVLWSDTQVVEEGVAVNYLFSFEKAN